MKARIIRPNEPTKMLLPRIGKIKCGMKDANGLPRSVDYFIATGDYAQYFHSVYPKENKITICFLSDDPNDCCKERLVYYNDSGRVCARGDGETFDVWNATADKYETLTVTAVPTLVDSIAKRFPSKYGWSHELTMNFMLPKVRTVVGFWQFTTKGKESSIPQIIGAFDAMMQITGHVKFIPFDLVVNFAKSQAPGKTSRYPVVSLVANAGLENEAIMQKFTGQNALTQ